MMRVEIRFWLALAFVTVYVDNPAGRLHNILTALQRHVSLPTPWQAWARTLGVSEDEVGELLRRISSVYELPAEIVSEIDLVPETEYDRDHALRWQGNVSDVLGARLFGPETAGQVIQRLGVQALSSLEHCSFLLYKFRREPAVSEQELERIADLLADLEEAIKAEPDMDADLRAFMMYHARQMSRALRDLPVRGRASLEAAFDEAVGAAQRRMDLTARAAEHPGPWEKFATLLMALAAALQLATAPLAILGEMHALEAPAPPAVTIINQPPEPSQPAATAGDHG